MARRLCLAVALLLVVPVVSLADTVNIGLISFDNLFNDGTTPSPSVFNISNFTGDPALGGNALPPDFPVFDLLKFLNSSLTLVMDDGSGGSITSLVTLGDIAPGFLDPTDPATFLEFPDTTMFSSATFAATLSQTTFLLDDGSTTFVADSPDLLVTLSAPPGSTLAAGTDFAVLSVSGTRISSSSVPEPSSLLLLGTGLIGLIGVKTRSRRA